MSLKNALFEIPRRNSLCNHCQESLTGGTPYYSVLNDDSDAAHQRQDYCITCWDRMPNQEIIEKAKCHWKSKVPGKNEKSALPLQKDEKAMELLKQAIADKKPEEESFAFLLALYLARKRLLLFRQELEEFGAIYSLYEVAATEDILPVKKVSLSAIEVDKIQNEIAQRLK